MKSLPPGVELGHLVLLQAEERPNTTDDVDSEMSCEFFETRQTFLSLCQGNHYQFDTLRRAKHSSMMVLYHLHNPEEPAFASNCNGCGCELEPGTGWRCTVCKDYDLCNYCKDQVGHPHPLQAAGGRGAIITASGRTGGNMHTGGAGGGHPSHMRYSADEKAQRARRLQRTLGLMEHAAHCGGSGGGGGGGGPAPPPPTTTTTTTTVADGGGGGGGTGTGTGTGTGVVVPESGGGCQDPFCKKIKDLFAHARQCEAAQKQAGCQLCRRLMQLVHLHARKCNASNCLVPKCNAFRAMLRRRVAAQDKARRAAYVVSVQNNAR